MFGEVVQVQRATTFEMCVSCLNCMDYGTLFFFFCKTYECPMEYNLENRAEGNQA